MYYLQHKKNSNVLLYETNKFQYILPDTRSYIRRLNGFVIWYRLCANELQIKSSLLSLFVFCNIKFTSDD